MQDPFEQAEIAHYSESERRQYFESQKEYWDNYSIMTTSHIHHRVAAQSPS